MSIFTVIFPLIPFASLTWWVWADWRLTKLGAGWRWRVGLGLMVLLMLTGYVWIFGERKDLWTAPLPASLYSLTLLWGVIFLPMLGLPMIFGWALWSLGRRWCGRGRSVKNPEQSIHRKWTRREWLGTLTVCFPLVATFGTAAYSLPTMKRFRLREITVSLKDLPEKLDGMRIAHVTDTHIGIFTRGHMIDDIVAATNRLEADLVVFTGDLIDFKIKDLPSGVAMLQKIQPGSGLFVIEGNHDLFDDPAAFVKGVRDSGLSLLRNEAATVRIRGVAVQILGITWSHEDDELAENVDTVAALRDPAAFPILLAHHPHAFDRAVERGFPLTLCGHTHGGQLMLTQGIGAGPVLFRYWTGLYQKFGRALVVSNGTGNWFPLRLNAPAEIIHLTLRRA